MKQNCQNTRKKPKTTKEQHCFLSKYHGSLNKLLSADPKASGSIPASCSSTAPQEDPVPHRSLKAGLPCKSQPHITPGWAQPHPHCCHLGLEGHTDVSCPIQHSAGLLASANMSKGSYLGTFCIFCVILLQKGQWELCQHCLTEEFLHLCAVFKQFLTKFFPSYLIRGMKQARFRLSIQHWEDRRRQFYDSHFNWMYTERRIKPGHWAGVDAVPGTGWGHAGDTLGTASPTTACSPAWQILSTDPFIIPPNPTWTFTWAPKAQENPNNKKKI